MPQTETKVLLCLYCSSWSIRVCSGEQEPLNLNGGSLSTLPRLGTEEFFKGTRNTAGLGREGPAFLIKKDSKIVRDS